MLTLPSAQQFAAILSHSGLSDARLASLFGVNQSTISRLRNCKIKKIGKYWAAAQESGLLTDGAHERFRERMAELEGAARQNPDLRVLLEKLHNFMQKLETH